MEKNIKWQLTQSSSIGNEFIDGSTEIFKSGKWAFLTREVIQNSVDAIRNKENKLIIKMNLENISTKNIPDKENIIKHLNGTLSINGLPDRCKNFTTYAKKMLENETIKILKISDYNTKGIIESEKENGEVESAWNALIYDEGNSQKTDENSTGSFGTGKNAPFALSGLNTVFYATKDINNQYAFEGVAKLFTSYIDGNKIERKIYYANKKEDGSLRPLTYEESVERLDKIFIREEIGSDIFIIGVEFNEEQIKREIAQAVIENFFVLLSDDKLEVELFGEIINRNSLWKMIEKYCDTPIEYTNSNIKYGYIKQYLNVYSKIYDVKEFKEDVVGAGKLRLLIAKGNEISGKYVAMFRNNGMKIFDDNIKTAQQNYSAIFFPGDEDTDKFLRRIENPTHDFFDPEVRIPDPFEKKQAIKRYNQIRLWIRNKIEEYTEILITENDYLDGMEEYIQLDDSEPENSVVNQPELEIISYENRTNRMNFMEESETTSGIDEKSDFDEDDGKSDGKNEFYTESTDESGNGTKGLVKDYHNKFKFKPRIISNNNIIKVAFSLEDYDSDTLNLEIESIGEDNSTSDYIPQITSAINLVNGEELKVVGNKIIDIDFATTNLVSIHFERKFESKYKVNVYKMRGENNEN